MRTNRCTQSAIGSCSGPKVYRRGRCSLQNNSVGGFESKLHGLNNKLKSPRRFQIQHNTFEILHFNIRRTPYIYGNTPKYGNNEHQMSNASAQPFAIQQIPHAPMFNHQKSQFKALNDTTEAERWEHLVSARRQRPKVQQNLEATSMLHNRKLCNVKSVARKLVNYKSRKMEFEA